MINLAIQTMLQWNIQTVYKELTITTGHIVIAISFNGYDEWRPAVEALFAPQNQGDAS